MAGEGYEVGYVLCGGYKVRSLDSELCVVGSMRMALSATRAMGQSPSVLEDLEHIPVTVG